MIDPPRRPTTLCRLRVRPPRHGRQLSRLVLALAAAAVTYFVVAYLAMPWLWRRYAARHPALEGIATITYTASGIPGDPLNLALVGSHNDLVAAMLAAGWFPADSLTLESCLRIAVDTVARRSYSDAPVSNLFYERRKEDLAFEQPVGGNPRERHHVRFWRLSPPDAEGTPIWVGAATFDHGVGFSHTTGQITHHVSSDIDAERDHVVDSLQRAKHLAQLSWIDDFQQSSTGHNGGGDPYQTDRRLAMGLLVNPKN